MNAIKEIIESIDVIVKENLKKVTSVYYCVVKEKLSDNKCKVFLNNKEYIVPFYGGTVIANKVYSIVLPFNNMNNSFVIGENADYNTLSNLPKINNVTLTDNKSLSDLGIFNAIYPVGSIYLSTTNINPSTLFGGTWQQIEDRFLLAAGQNYNAGDIGGESTHTLTIEEMPAHSHDIKLTNSSLASGSNYARISSTGSWGEDLINSVGGGQAHNNMPPYLVVYVWKRIQ